MKPKMFISYVHLLCSLQIPAKLPRDSGLHRHRQDFGKGLALALLFFGSSMGTEVFQSIQRSQEAAAESLVILEM